MLDEERYLCSFTTSIDAFKEDESSSLWCCGGAATTGGQHLLFGFKKCKRLSLVPPYTCNVNLIILHMDTLLQKSTDFTLVTD